jgi:hypothetical protein
LAPSSKTQNGVLHVRSPPTNRLPTRELICRVDRMLTPAFTTSAVKGMFADMVDIASQLLLKWERIGSDVDINPVPDFTRLAYDTVALCSMSHRCVPLPIDFAT